MVPPGSAARSAGTQTQSLQAVRPAGVGRDARRSAAISCRRRRPHAHDPLDVARRFPVFHIRFRVAPSLAAGAAVLLMVSGCASNADPAADRARHSMSDMSMPSGMGMSPTTGGPASPSTTPGATSVPTGSFNAADLRFAQMMIVHHEGAIDMADLAPARAASDEVKSLAADIAAAQGPEIALMAEWVTAWTAPAATPVPATGSTADDADDMGGMDHGGMDHSGMDHGGMDHGGMDHGGMDHGGMDDGSAMPGMMSDAQMGVLEAASGPAFDELFLTLMLEHHQGAVDMARTELADGLNAEALTLADRIVVDQTAEIAEMRSLLQRP
ncbi:DUF305 domain-containing protein [Nakamurella leprariae]|uniref:DUF305 domain-containing protein n=1 Tax=Nakamurella leprariae TaxID=2803911 RepID=A0A938YDR8_9ACTN|nr:DUF305 domain-containing protein [Nakamurella leprariae]MBM9465995.1 DUF305 domain-containing protein [Nakamurella leprariae]